MGQRSRAENSLENERRRIARVSAELDEAIEKNRRLLARVDDLEKELAALEQRWQELKEQSII